MVQVREELINMLKNKETEQSKELTALQQNLEHRINIVGEVRRIYFSLFYFL
jgi:predicted nucleic acid-binding protein